MKVQNNTASITSLKVKPLIIGVLAAVAICFGGLLLSALLMTFVDLSEGFTAALSLFSAATGAFVGGMLAARLSEQRGWLVGLVCGVLLFLLILLIGFAVYRSVNIGFLFVKPAVLFPSGMIGGMIGVNKK